MMNFNINSEILISNSLTPDEFVYLYKKYINNYDDMLLRVNIDELKMNDYLDSQNNLTEKSKSLFIPDITSWIVEYRELFPNIRLPGRNPRGDLNSCIKKMKEFTKKHPQYSKEDILNCTKKYIKNNLIDNYKYLKSSHYFIEKEGISTLLSQLELNEPEDNSSERITNI